MNPDLQCDSASVDSNTDELRWDDGELAYRNALWEVSHRPWQCTSYHSGVGQDNTYFYELCYHLII